MSKERILILDSGYPNSLSFHHYFGSSDCDVFAGAQNKLAISFFSNRVNEKFIYPESGYLENYGRGTLIDKSQVKKFISCLKKYVEDKGIDNLICLSESTLIPVSFFREELNSKLYPKKEVIKKLHDKLEFFKRISDHKFKNFKIPKTYGAKEESFPCIVRPRRGFGSRFTYLCYGRESLKNSIKKIELYGRKPLIQQYIPSSDKFAPNLLINKDGKIIRAVSSKRISKSTIKKVFQELEEFFRDIKFFGFASPQFISYDGELYIIEINPRLSVNWFGLDFGADLPKAFHESIIKENEVEKRLIFVNLFPGFRLSSKLYWEKAHDLLPILKSCVSYLYDNFHNTIKPDNIFKAPK